ncbi:hypothetical protein AVM15_17535 [Paraclostridium benzoelyticum]|nr:hypothetical protein AVM15_17535 [Paraclostridium benzoelyticum]
MKIKRRFAEFIEEKGIAKKLSEHLVNNGTVEISVIGLRWILILFIISVLINFSFLIRSGIIQQCIFSFFEFIWNGIIIGFLSFLKDLDKSFPGLLSFLGSVTGGILGFWGATKVFKTQVKINKNQSIDKLMHILLYTYRIISKFSEMAVDDEKFQKALKKSDLYKALVYDKNWRNYISEINDYEDKENILRWLFNIEHQIVYDINDTKEYLLSIEKILIKHGYKYQLNIVKKEVDVFIKEVKSDIEKKEEGQVS